MCRVPFDLGGGVFWSMDILSLKKLPAVYLEQYQNRQLVGVFQMRSGCAFMVHVCEDEYQLYWNFFSKPTPLLE